MFYYKSLFSHRIQTEQANEIARLIRQYITIDQKSRDANGNQEGVSSRQAFVKSNPITTNNKYMVWRIKSTNQNESTIQSQSKQIYDLPIQIHLSKWINNPIHNPKCIDNPIQIQLVLIKY